MIYVWVPGPAEELAFLLCGWVAHQVIYAWWGRLMLRACKWCGRVHDGECPSRPKRVKYNSSEAERIRNTSRWRRKREQIRQRDKYLCRWCLTQGRLTYTDLEVHHIVPINVDPDLALDDDNLITLCSRCHELAERGELGDLRALAGVPPEGIGQ